MLSLHLSTFILSSLKHPTQDAIKPLTQNKTLLDL